MAYRRQVWLSNRSLPRKDERRVVLKFSEVSEKCRSIKADRPNAVIWIRSLSR